MVSHFSFQGGSKLVKPTQLKVMGGNGIRDFHNGDVVELFPNGEGRHGSVLRLLDSCCRNVVLGDHSVGKKKKTEAEARACFDLVAAYISDLEYSERDGGSVPSREGKFPMSFWSLVSGYSFE